MFDDVRRFSTLTSAALAFTALSAFACGSKTGSSSSGGGGTTDKSAAESSVNVTTGSMSFSCCLNGENYSCPDQGSAEKCGEDDPSGCMDEGPTSSGECP